MVLKCLDSDGVEIKEKKCNIKSYLFSLDGMGRGILKLIDEGFGTVLYGGIISCYSDSTCIAFKTMNNTTFVVSDC